MSAIEAASNAASEAAAVKILTAAGWPLDYARESAALMFGSLNGDLIEAAGD